MCSKVSSDWLPSYIKAMRPVLEIFKTAGYFLDSPLTLQELRYRLPSFLILALDWGKWSALWPSCFSSGEEHAYPLNRRVGGLHAFCRREKFLVPARNQTPDYPACSLVIIQVDQKVSVYLMITIQKATSNVQSVPRQSPDIYWHSHQRHLYIIMVSDWNCSKYFCMFFVL
jgi:hypothetical protein